MYQLAQTPTQLQGLESFFSALAGSLFAGSPATKTYDFENNRSPRHFLAVWGLVPHVVFLLKELPIGVMQKNPFLFLD